MQEKVGRAAWVVVGDGVCIWKCPIFFTLIIDLDPLVLSTETNLTDIIIVAIFKIGLFFKI